MPVTVTRDNTAAFQAAVAKLIKAQVVVGIPDSEAERKPAPGETKAPSNALIGYVMEFGEPDKNIPARPFLLPGVEGVEAPIVERLKQAGEATLSGDLGAVTKGLMAVGLVAQNAVRAKITDGPFAPLSERTIKDRASRGRKGAKQYLKLKGEGVPEDILQGADLVKPLIDTGQLRAAVTYVVRDR